MKTSVTITNRRTFLILIGLVGLAILENIAVLYIGQHPLRIVVDTVLDLVLILVAGYFIYALARHKEIAEKTIDLRGQLLDVAMDSIIAHDLEGTVVYANQAAEQTRGYTAEELPGKKIYDLVSPGEQCRRSKARLRDWQAGDILERFESVHVRNDGTEFPVEIHGRISQINGKKIFLGVVRDITERRRFEDALRQSEAKYRELVENASSIVLRLDTQGNITFFNEFAQTFFGYREEEVIGRNVVGTIVPERDSTGFDLAAKLQDVVIHPERYMSSENENMRRNGERVWVAWTNKAILDAQGNLSEILCIGIDRTEQRRVEKALVESEARFRTLFESAQDVIFIKDRDSRYTAFNPAVQQFFDQPVASLLGRRDRELFGEEVAAQVLEEDHRVLNGEMVKTRQTLPVRGVPTLFHMVKAPLRDDASNIIGICGIARDVTDLQRAEEALRTSETNYRTLVEHSHSLILRLNPLGNIIFANTFAQKFSGYATGEIIGKPIIGTIMPAVDSEGFDLAAKIKDLMINPELYRSSWTEAIRQDGLRRWVEWNFSAVYDSEGKLVEILCVGIDRTDRKWTERTLTRLSQELSRRVITRTADLEAIKSRLQHIINTTPAIIFTADITPPHNLTFVSDYVHYLGFEPGDLVGTPLFDLDRVHSDDRSQVSLARLQMALALETLDQDHQITVQYRVAKKDGTYSWVQVTARIEKNESGAPVEIVACWIDLTRQKELEQTLEILSGPSMKLKVWKKSGKTLQALSPTLLPQSWALLQECLQAALSGETITGVTLQLQGKNGESLHGLLTTGPVKEPKGTSHETVGVVIELRHKKTSLH